MLLLMLLYYRDLALSAYSPKMQPIIRLIAELELYLHVGNVTPHEAWEINTFILQLKRKLTNDRPDLRTNNARRGIEDAGPS